MNHLAAALAAISVLLAFVAPSVSAEAAEIRAPSVVETPASQQARRFLDAITTGDDESFLRFIREAYPTSKLSTAEWLDLRPNLRGLEYHAVAEADATKASLSAYDAQRENWVLLQVSVEAEAPHAITSFGVRMGRRPRDVPGPAKLQPAELVAATQAKVEAMAAADSFAGALLIAKDGRPLLDAAYGLADRDARRPNTVETQFRFGSMGKMFTAVAIMQLAQAGKLDLTAPIGRYLKDYPNPEIATQVTTDMLLTHTGGTGDIFGPEFEAHRQTLRDGKDYVALYGARAPLFRPWSRVAYSNYGFILMGRIVEEVSGLSYDEYLQRNVFAPAHMAATGNQPETVRLPRRAVSYMRDKNELTSAAATLPYRGTAAGGGYSTTGDLLRFANALMANRLLDAEHTKLLTEGGVTGPNGTLFRYDFSGVTDEGRRFYGHGGNAPGMSGALRIFPEGYTLVVLANRDAPAAGIAVHFISERLP
jgi:CubicO group peptidase (beta-lactamase class C family)